MLDRLLEEPRLQFDGISGTSAGAMNAAVMASGLMQGGNDGARAALEEFWKSVSDAARMSPLRRGPIEILTGNWTLDYSPVFAAVEFASQVFSPYDTSLAGSNPLTKILAEASTSRIWSTRRSSCSSPPPMCIREAAAFSATPT